MTLPPWWPRTECVYCGTRIMSTHPNGAMYKPVWACESHRRLLASDPMYAADLGEAVSAAREREGC